MQPLSYLQTTGGIVWTAACVLLGFALTWTAFFIINKIPAAWLCDYNETPDAELLSGKRFSYVSTGIPTAIAMAVCLVLCRLQFNKGYDIYFLLLSLIIYIALLIAASDLKYQIIPDQFLTGGLIVVYRAAQIGKLRPGDGDRFAVCQIISVPAGAEDVVYHIAVGIQL